MELVDDKLNAPATFAFDPSEDLEDFFLFAPVGKAFGGDGEATKRGRRDTTGVG